MTSNPTPTHVLIFGLVVLVAAAGPAFADRVTLNDGTVIEGTVIRQGDNYWVKTRDGQRKVVAVGDVKSVQKGSSPSAPT